MAPEVARQKSLPGPYSLSALMYQLSFFTAQIRHILLLISLVDAIGDSAGRGGIINRNVAPVDERGRIQPRHAGHSQCGTGKTGD